MRIVLAALLCSVLGAVAAGPGAADEALTNDGVIKMVKAGLPESVIIQKIRTSEKKLDTSPEALIKLKNAGVSDRVLEAMVGAVSGAGTTAARTPAPTAAAPGEPVIAHVVGNERKPLKSVIGSMEFKVEPFAGSRQEVVLPEPRARYRIAEKEPTFISPNTDLQWILVRLKPGKRDRNLPMSDSGGYWSYGGTTFRHGVDPKYAIKLTTESAPRGGVRIRPAEPLKSGEYGFVAASRGQINLNEVFEFAVE